MTLPRVLPGVAVLLTFFVLAASPAPSAPLVPHLDLASSAPAADSTVSPPGEIRLWFTQVPASEGTSARLVDAAGELVELGEWHQDTDDGKIFHADVPTRLADGTYSVRWRAIAADGHAVTGDFGFMVGTAR